MPTPQHYVWAAGHFLSLFASLRYLVASFTFSGPSALWYKASYFGAMVSYAIVCHKAMGFPQPNLAWIRRAFLDENVQYFLLAFIWFTSRPISISLLPYMIFSLFHALTFTRTNLMARYMPGPPATAGGPPTAHPLSKKLQTWVKTNYDSAMRIVAYIELFIFARVLLGAVTFQNSLIAPLIFAHFLRQRYYQSAFSREAIASTNRQIEGLVKKPGNPMLVQVWEKVQMLVQRWAGTSIAPQPAAAAGAAGARR